MQFLEKNFLLYKKSGIGTIRRQVDTFLCGTRAVATWKENFIETGYDLIFLYPAWVDGKRCWLHQREFLSTGDNKKYSISEGTVDFECGIHLLAEHGCWNAFIIDNDPAVNLIKSMDKDSDSIYKKAMERSAEIKAGIDRD